MLSFGSDGAGPFLKAMVRKEGFSKFLPEVQTFEKVCHFMLCQKSL